MPRRPQPAGTKGSLRWIQKLVNEHSPVLDAAINRGTITWCSPLADDEFAEYCDDDFLQRLDVPTLTRPLATFWPRSGPRWDALGVAESGALVLVEAKAHALEMATSWSAVAESQLIIEKAFAETADRWKVSVTPGWTDSYYQYANRLAHAYFLNEVNRRPALLVFLHIVGDVEMKGPSSREAWMQSIDEAQRSLGVAGKRPSYVIDAFIDISSGILVVA